jgi:methyl-accepting chemotaxis protein
MKLLTNFSTFMQRWLGAKKISNVIMILIGLGVAPAFVVTAVSVYREYGAIQYADAELLAAVDFHHLEEISSHASSRMIMGVLPEAKRDQAKFVEAEAELAEAIEKVRAAMAKAAIPNLEPFWRAVLEAYEGVKSTAPGTLSTHDWFAKHEQLFAAVLKLRDRVGVETGVILDPGPETYPMVNSMFIRIPELEVEMGRSIGYGVLLTQNDRSPEVIDGVVLAKGNLIDEAAGLESDIADAVRFSTGDAAAYEEIQQSLDAAAAKRSELSKLLEGMRLNPELADLDALLGAAEGAVNAVDTLHDVGSDRLEALLRDRRQHSLEIVGFTLGAFVGFLLLASWSGTLIGRGISRSLSVTVNCAERIAAGHYDNEIEVRGDNETGRVLRAVGIMQRQLRERIEEQAATREKEQVAAAENLRIKVGLDNVSGNVLIAGKDGRVIYLNHAAQRVFREAAADFRSLRPQFDAERIVGDSMDFTGRSGNEGRAASQSQLAIGRRTFRVSVSPVVDAGGEWLGTVSEWTDRTQEVAVEEEVATIVTAASSGDLSKRIQLQGKEGFFATLANGMNGILDNLTAVMAEVRTVLDAGRRQDLTQRVDTRGKSGAFAELSSGINALMDSMMDVVQQIQSAAQSVALGSAEIAKGNSDLSSRTEEQASSLEETASSMEEMTATVKHNADNASQANQLARAARAEAEQGGAVVSNAVVAMQGINESSKRIADILGVIDEIAFQTNLLALNAAVEAARAGEQGRGFAVVATEVRSLAGRSAAAAKEIKQLIHESVGRVEEGTKLVDQSGATLTGIVDAIKRVSDIVAEISAASQEQSAGIEQVNKAIVQMDGLTQQNAALVEEAAAAAESLQEQAHSLQDNMSRFRVTRRSPATADTAESGAARPSRVASR